MKLKSSVWILHFIIPHKPVVDIMLMEISLTDAKLHAR